MNNSVFTGRRRRGKTTRAMSKAMENSSLVIVFDPKREFLDWPHTAHSVSEVMAAMDAGATVIIFHPSDIDADFSELAQFVWALHEFGMEHHWQDDATHKPIVFLIDESHQLQSPHAIHDDLKSIMQKARPELLVVFQTTQSPSFLYSASKIANSEWFFFYTTHVADLERIEKIAGTDVREAVKNLGENRHYVWFSEDEQTYEIVAAPDDWYCDLIFKNKEGNTVAKQRVEVDESFLDALAERVGKILKGGNREKNDKDDSEDEGIVLVLPKSKKE